MMKNWYNYSIQDALSQLNSDEKSGLSSQEAQSRLEKYGKNELDQGKKKSLFAKFIDQFKDPMILILIAASIISAFVGEIEDTFIILAIVVINSVLSVYQEGKAEAAIEALQKMSAPHAKVIRDGKITEIESTKVVPGDIVILETGSIVPADIRIISSTNLKIDESSLTGESVPVEKYAEAIYDGEMEIGDRENIGHSSTIVTYGRGRGLVTSTGKETEIGKIASSLLAYDDEQTPLQKKLAGLSKSLGILVIVISAIVFAVGLLYKMDLLETLLISISLAVAAIPEGLPAIVTIVLSLGMGRMADKNAIVKKLLAVETLGTTTVICSDKTGTLTQNQMTVTKAYVNGQVIEVSGTGYEPVGNFSLEGSEVNPEDFEELKLLMGISTLVNDADLKEVESGYEMIGDPTEGALLTFSEKAGINQEDLNEKHPRLSEIPFDSARKMMTTFHENFVGQAYGSLTKGAPDIIISRSSKILLDGKEVDFTEDLKNQVLEMNKTFARSALRVLSYAYKKWDSLPEEADLNSDYVEKDMVFVGLTGMIDPARPEVKDAIKQCKTAGIVPIMITGDYLDTAYAIGEDLGIAESEDQAIMGRELNSMSPEEIREVVKTKRIFARVSPENKVQIVTALKENGAITAMTGDGVNDAPAIKKADIGIAMGITGTDVAKNTAEVILTDDNFATIVSAVEEGRIIYSNIKKFVSFLLSCNIGEVLVVFLAIIFKLPVPFTPKQLLWLNLVTDSFPAMALGVEPGEEDIMDQAPRKAGEPIVDKTARRIIAVQSIAITIATLVAFWFGLEHYGRDNLNGARTMAFVTLILAELLRSYTARSDKYTVWHLGIFSNMKLVVATVISFALMLAVLYVPVLADLFDTLPIHSDGWFVVIPCAFLPLVMGEISKVIANKKNK
ncbi:MAG: cation-translocating P-type ATPase [Bacillota bacterium]|nr:cation-translocating P-type ATPase [Bacillota bacterium]